MEDIPQNHGNQKVDGKGIERDFLFLIESDDESIQRQCPSLAELRKYGIICDGDHGPVFGIRNICIGDDCNEEVGLYSSYCKQIWHNGPDVNICGGNVEDNWIKDKFYFQVIDYSVFKIIQ